MRNQSPQNLAYICKLLHESVQLPVSCYPAETETAVSYRSSPAPDHPKAADPEQHIRSLIAQAGDTEGPVVLITDYMEHYIVLPVHVHMPPSQLPAAETSAQTSQSRPFVLIGPCLDHTPTGETIRIQLSDLGISYRDASAWTAYWRALPVVSRLRLLHIAALAHAMINRETVDVMDILQRSFRSMLGGARSGSREHVELTLTSSRESAVFHSGLEEEKRLFALIRAGDKEELLKRLINIRYEGIGLLSRRSQLRNMKNLAICAVALGMRAAVEGGLYEEMGYTLSDLHIQQIEELNDARAVEAAMLAALADFAERVRQNRQSPVSKPVKLCKEYIYRHLYEDITLKQLAGLTGLNGSYLSQLFKKETGMTITNYVQHERIEEAKKLLDHTDDTISAIGSRLLFYDESHFVKVFKKHAGITPKRYRNRNSST